MKDRNKKLPAAYLSAFIFSALQIRTTQRSITANFRSLTAHIYHLIIIVTGGFSKKSFLLILFLCFRNSYERS